MARFLLLSARYFIILKSSLAIERLQFVHPLPRHV
jgi:hypothetical protein